MNPLCRNGHPKNPGNTYQGRCRLCRALNARRYRSEGRQHAWENPERKKKENRKDWAGELAKSRAYYHANKKRVAKMRRINRLQNIMNLSPRLFVHLTELVAEVSAIKTISRSNLPPHPKVRFVAGR